jgi:enterochelin esterase-like enzyme
MHGRGEALKGSERGARAWIDDYWLDRGLERVARPPLRGSDFLGSADAERLRRMNDSLRSEPYQGLIIVMPYTPDMLRGPQPFEAALPLATFLVDELLPRVYRETPALGSPPSTGIDGVSLGGRAALSVGLERPEAFGAVASLQAAFGTEDARKIAERARLARARNPGLKLRLLTSDGDFFLDAHRAISAALSDMRVEHEFLIVAGPHDYEFNRGPGLFEMLLFHDRVLRGKSAP